MFSLGNKSFIQGSKLASEFYAIYTLDLGRLNRIMAEKEMYSMLTGEQ